MKVFKTNYDWNAVFGGMDTVETEWKCRDGKKMNTAQTANGPERTMVQRTNTTDGPQDRRHNGARPKPYQRSEGPADRRRPPLPSGREVQSRQRASVPPDPALARDSGPECQRAGGTLRVGNELPVRTRAS